MDIETSKRIWASDEVYVKINNYFCKYGTYSKIIINFYMSSSFNLF